MSKETHFMSPKDTATDILNMMFGTNFTDIPLDEINPVQYHKTPEEISRKFFLLQAIHLLADPKIGIDQILREVTTRVPLSKLGEDAEYFIQKKLNRNKFNDKELYYITTISRDQTTVLAQALCLEPCVFDKQVLCRSSEENWKSIRNTCAKHSEKNWYVHVCPPQEMATEYDFVTCLLALYDEKEPCVHSFLAKHNLYERLSNYWYMLDWLFTDRPFDIELG